MTSRRRVERRRTGRPPAAERDEVLAARRDELLDAAIAAITADGPDVSMTRMAAEAGVTKPVLYRHFGDRAGLHRAVARRFADRLMTDLVTALTLDGPPRETLAAAIDAYLRAIEEQPEVYRYLTRRIPAEDPGGGEQVAHFVHHIGAAIGSIIGERMRAANVDSGGAEIIGHGLTGLVQQAGEVWLDRPHLPRHRVVAYLTDLLWQGFEGLNRPAAEAAVSPRSER